LVKKSLLLKRQQLILGTGIAIWWLTEPHWRVENVVVAGNMALADYFLEPYKKVLQNWTRQLKKKCL
jgi:hypothetical protein